LLTDSGHWESMSRAARVNSLRFEYQKTVRPLLDMLGADAGN